MVKEKNTIKMEISNMKEILLMLKEKEMVNIYMKMVDIIQVNLKMTYPMKKEFNIIKMELLIMKVIGLIGNMQEMVKIFLKMKDIKQANSELIKEYKKKNMLQR